ncbi:MAG: immunoglobulin domain-containing protein [Verrucomicrobia bacterium]|nr:immunoglobulin domain-containing protein [Verrucomicrobiota bacterium]
MKDTLTIPPRLASSPRGVKARFVPGLLAAVGMLLGLGSARAGTVTYDFKTDPTTGPNAIQVFQSGFADDSGNSVYWKDSGGNPDGFLAITWPLGSSSTIAIFPDIDGGKTVTAFKFETDLRIGNPQQNVRAADGFSINFARSSDDVFVNHASSDFATSGAVETGTKTGLAISFDTWSGNTLPDGADIEGIIVRVDNVTVLRYGMPTRNGDCNDTTSLQTGPRDTAYWEDPTTGAKNAGTLPGAAFLPASWAGLCWQHLSVELDDQSKLTVIWKGKTILDHFQTSFFPSPGGIVLAGRTGGADEHTHFDNLKLTTTASTDAKPPTAASNLKAASIKARKVVLTWDPATDDSGRVGYNIYRDGTLLATSVSPTYTDRAVSPTKTYSYAVEAIDPSQNKAAKTAPLSVTTLAEALIPLKGYATFETWDNIGTTAVDALTSDARYPDSPTFKSLATALDTRTVYADDSHENYGGRMTALLTPTDTANYDFFLRSDDASQLWLSTDDKPANLAQIAEETGCCAAFQEPGDPRTTAAPIKLTAGKSYYVQVLWKEGGGGDYAQVAWRKAGDTTAASLLSPIPGSFLSTQGDPTAGPPVITKKPAGTEAAIGGSATFTVESTVGEDPKTYQWSHGGSAIAGATSASYTLNNVAISDLGLYTVTVSNGEGSVSASAALFIKGTLFIEAEDFDYGGGKTITDKPIGMTGKYPGGDFRDLGTDADADIDWHNGGNAGQPYRPNTAVAAGKPNQHPDGIPRGSFDVTVNHVVGWNDDGDWQNYSRTFPAAADYNIYGRLSSGGNPIHSELDEVTAGFGTANQTLSKIGEFNPKRATAGWDSMEYFPLVDDAGKPVVIKGWGGKKTIRWTALPGANQDIDYIMFIPAAAASNGGGAPKLSVAVVAGKVVITFEGTLQGSDTVNGTFADVAGATSPFTADTSKGAKFYKAKR